MLQRLWRRIAGLESPQVSPEVPAQPAATARAVPLTRDAYIRSPLPIAAELHALFDTNDELVIFDIGSCEGEDSIRYAREFPKSRIYAFEPLPANMAILQRQVKAYGATQVEAFAIALSDEAGRAAFYVSSGSPAHLPSTEDWEYGNKASSLLPPEGTREHYPWLKFDHSIEVPTETLAAFCAARGINRIDFIHMDVQGAELKVLRGAGDMLPRIRAIWLEVERVALYGGQPLAEEVEAFMEENGFVKRLDTLGQVTGDQLYIRSGAF